MTIKEKITLIKNKVTLIDIINKYTDMHLQPIVIQKISCPLHLDKTPSMSINLDKKMFHCFSCGSHGDILDLVSLICRIPLSKTMIRIIVDFNLVFSDEGDDSEDFTKKLEEQKQEKIKDKLKKQESEIINTIANKLYLLRQENINIFNLKKREKNELIRFWKNKKRIAELEEFYLIINNLFPAKTQLEKKELVDKILSKAIII